MSEIGKHVLLYGGSGFVGRHLAIALDRHGFHVTSVGRTPPEAALQRVPSEIRFRQVGALLEGSETFDVVVHLACEIDVRNSMALPESFIRENIEPSLAVGSLVRHMAPRPLVIYLSSDRVYGAGIGDLTESSPTIPVEPYGAVKLAGEAVLAAYARLYDFSLTVVRAANVYGPFQRPVQLIPTLLNKIRAGNRSIPVGDLEVVRNFLYIDDLVAALMKLAGRGSSPRVDIFNVGGEERRVGEVVDLIRRVSLERLGVDVEFVPVEALRRSGRVELGAGLLSSDKARRVLGWEATTSLADGLTRILEWEGAVDESNS